MPSDWLMTQTEHMCYVDCTLCIGHCSFCVCCGVWPLCPYMCSGLIHICTCSTCTQHSLISTWSAFVQLQGECVVLDAFMSETYVAKLIGYLCLEEKKGSDHFSRSRMTVFVVRNTGCTEGSCLNCSLVGGGVLALARLL